MRLGHALDIALVTLVTVAAFWRVLHNGFVNWDDPVVLVNNAHLAAPYVVRWAFTTTLIGHYQPLAWLTWSAVKSLFGVTAEAFHGLSLVGHVVNGVLVYLVTRRLAEQGAVPLFRSRAAALVAAVVFAVHPVRVEAVAWASAFPYVLSLTVLLLAFLAYLNYAAATGSRAAIWLSASLIAYVASLFTRAGALGFPLTLLLVDIYPLGRQRRDARVGRLVLEKLPFAVVAAAAAIAEWQAREIATLQDVGIGARLTMAVTAPFIYLGRTLLPLRLSPLDPLPIVSTFDAVPLLVGAAALAALTVAAWTARRSWPAVGVGWMAYAVMLAPVAGFTPSGLQATADRYMYVPGVIVSLVIGAAAARAWPSERRALAVPLLAGAVTAALGALTWQQTGYWHDSITLWTRAADLDPRDDVATYNLAIALAEAGRDDEAMRRYEQTVQLVPDHALARQNLAILQAARAEREADRFAEAGRLDEASDAYARALALDSNRLHARAAHGVVLMRRGRIAEAATELRVAFDAHVKDLEVPNALAFALMQTGRAGEAVVVLKRAMAEHPDNLTVAHNLARLLATAPDPQVRDGALALRLALDVRDRTGGRDPRALDTLAAAYAAVNRFDMARATASQAAARARQLGDHEAAEEIAAHARSYAR